MVDLILLERVEKLGQMGQMVKVKPGYARNYLLPQKKAMRATRENLAYFETQRAQLEATNLQRKSEAGDVAGKMEDVTVVLIRQAGESGQLYGSVSARDIADAVTAAGYTVGKQQIVLDRPAAPGQGHAASRGLGQGDRQCGAIRGRRAHAGGGYQSVGPARGRGRNTRRFAGRRPRDPRAALVRHRTERGQASRVLVSGT